MAKLTYRLLYTPNYTEDKLIFGDYQFREEAEETGKLLVGVSNWYVQEITDNG